MTPSKLQVKTWDSEHRTQNAVFSSNCIRLSTKEWIFVGITSLVFVFLIPVFWQSIDKFSPGRDYRMPYELSNDYWLYERYCRTACSQNEIPVIGDSVIWGHFVPRDKTFSHYLDEITDDAQFVNLGLDGIHPAAMEGLLRYYGKDISNQKVILHFNPLWMSSPKQDLQGNKEFVFNHPKLVAQFIPNIPCYKAPLSARISAVLRRYVTFPNWVSHLNMTNFQNYGVPTWSIENPYKNPLSALTFNLPEMDYYEQPESTSRPKNNATPVSSVEDRNGGYQWVAPETSFQWSRFQRTIQLLQKRKNRVFVLVGPFNENMLEETNFESYQNLKKEIELWLTTNNIDYYAPPALPAELYVDASHPTGEGYALLAQQLYENESFKGFVLNTGRD